MNCPSRTDDTLENPSWNQSPPPFSPDTTTRNDFNGLANSRVHRRHAHSANAAGDDPLSIDARPNSQQDQDPGKEKVPSGEVIAADSGGDSPPRSSGSPRQPFFTYVTSSSLRCARTLVKFSRFIGPGFLIAVAYIDPGNYATDVAAGADFKYALLFIVLLSNLFAILLQSLCIKLGSVTGLNLAENCREHLPKWLVICLYILAEAAIIATDIAEVVGSAIALNLLLKIPLVAGCAITLVDVLFILIFYRPNGQMWGLRLFEFFVMALVLYQSCGILGATVMPHSLFLGSGVVQSRLKEFDVNSGYVDTSVPLGSADGEVKYRPSIHAIRGCMKYSIIELALSLFTFALFVNSAILIVAGAALYDVPGGDNADLFGIHTLLSQSIAPAAGLVFALALLLSGISAGIVCTIAGQMVSEGMLNWTIRPWLRRLITRSISIIPSIIIAAAVGKDGLDKTLTASQVVLSVILPFVSAPLIWFTCLNRYMTVRTEEPSEREGEVDVVTVPMRNNIITSVVAVLVWVVIVVMNVALLVLVGMGKA
ncbi:Natural resistance-associated macrophage protein [Penicillium expansum]|uniref:Natural resistance-associated macrophage protein n=1 Tax=Penicillium expansum TaxID=27334 RepID=A0A0A2JHB6_PENEN|nr:Natural resistance-associated macrophage protein [Penicillium expansum]KGO38086.1 Natural resistance-associated macrophage protein [Penicillium expansum]KGO44961.1 Natural resistance-associated macrophage protein [Penicillium expansum]KGO51690.1 Natural resistance-associated macrophage protein [Penicillium expansum]